MCFVIMFTAMGTGKSTQKAKHAAAKALLDEIATGAKKDVSGVGTNSTIPEA